MGLWSKIKRGVKKVAKKAKKGLRKASKTVSKGIRKATDPLESAIKNTVKAVGDELHVGNLIKNLADFGTDFVVNGVEHLESAIKSLPLGEELILAAELTNPELLAFRQLAANADQFKSFVHGEKINVRGLVENAIRNNIPGHEKLMKLKEKYDLSNELASHVKAGSDIVKQGRQVYESNVKNHIERAQEAKRRIDELGNVKERLRDRASKEAGIGRYTDIIEHYKNPIGFRNQTKFNLPSIRASIPNIPSIRASIPKIPSIKRPKVRAPRLNSLRINPKELNIPSIQAPRLNIPSVPSIQAPKFNIPSVPSINRRKRSKAGRRR